MRTTLLFVFSLFSSGICLAQSQTKAIRVAHVFLMNLPALDWSTLPLHFPDPRLR
jgi:hypothetical protein